MNNMFNLSGKVALVTGSSRGIGKSIAYTLANAGAKVYLHGVSLSPALQNTFNEMQNAGLNVEVAIGDIGNKESLSNLMNSTADVDIVVLNASVQKYGHIHDFNDEDFDSMVNANIRATMEMIRFYGEKLSTKGWGRIISIGSVNQAHPAPRLAIYASTKAAMKAIALTASKEYAPFGVTVNTITPGVISTDRNSNALSNKEFADNLLEAIPAKRFGTPDDLAGIALCLASECSAYITGADIVVDGGFSL